MTKTTRILWMVFIAVLGVLLPHTAWAFKNFEPVQSPTLVGAFTVADLIAWSGAFAFECAIAVLVHKLSLHLETRTGKRGFQRFAYQYLNPIGLGLLIATSISVLANLAHAVQYGGELKIFTAWGIPQGVYAVAFGGILPFVSLIFARVLSNVVGEEEGPNPEVLEAKHKTDEIRAQLKETEKQFRIAEEARKTAEARFAAAGDMMKRLFADDKRERIIFVHQRWPSLPNSVICTITDASPSHVSEVLKEWGSAGDILELESKENAR